MAKKYKIDYELIYEGGGKTRLGTYLYMEGNSSSEAISKIRGKNNLTSNVKEIIILDITED